MPDRISVIIPTLNRVEYLKRVLPSYLKQRYLQELVIIDDGSTDDTVAFLKSAAKKEQRITILLNTENIGLPASRMKAFQITKSPYIFFGENDLELGEDHLGILLDHLKRSGADIIAGRRIWMGKGETPESALRRRDNLKGKPLNPLLLTTDCEIRIEHDTELPLIEASMLMKRKVLETVPFDLHFRKNAWREESDFQLSAAEKGYKLVSCPHTVTFHMYKPNDTGGNHSASLLTYEIELFRNNYYFVNKHKEFIRREFGISSIPVHLTAFVFHRAVMKNLVPSLVRTAVEFKRDIFPVRTHESD